MTPMMPEFVTRLIQICHRSRDYVFKLNYSFVFYMSINDLFHEYQFYRQPMEILS